MPENTLLTGAPAAEQKHVKTPEFAAYLVAVFFYTCMTGMLESYRSAYLVNVLKLESSQTSIFNTLISVIPFFLNFFIAMFIDNRKIGKSGKFRPLILMSAIPVGALLVLTFITPTPIVNAGGALLITYLTAIAILFGIFSHFAGTINSLAVVLTPNMKERDTVMSFRSISSAVGNSAPLVIILVIGLIWKDEATQYIIGASLCAAVGIFSMLIGIKATKERIAYTKKRENPLIGFKEVLVNPHAWVIIISEFLKNFRKVSTYMGVFLAAALLGSTSKFLLFGLPTGIGTAVGMLLINFLLKKFTSRTLYIASGVYSLIINALAFTVGYIYFKNGSSVLQIVFIVFLFLIGLQFGASNLLPNMFQADVLEDLELKTGKRLDASLPFVVGIGTLFSGTIANALAPRILYGDSSIIQYIQPTDLIPNPEQSLKTKILMLFFYTVVHGIMMFLAGVPYFFFKLTGKRKQDIHEAVLANRKAIEEGEIETVTDAEEKAE